MPLTYRPFSEAPEVEEFKHELEHPKPKPAKVRSGSPGLLLMGAVLIALSGAKKKMLRRLLLFSGFACIALGLRSR